jgi:hypothetical protein
MPKIAKMSPPVLRSIALGYNYSLDAVWHRLSDVFPFQSRYYMMPARYSGFDQLVIVFLTSLRNANL